MKLCAACHQDLPKDKFSKKQWKSGAQSQRRCTSCVRDNREVVQPPANANDNDVSAANNNESADTAEVDSLFESMGINDNDMRPVSDEELFKQPPQKEDCPICFIRMPSLWTAFKYNSCCGKVVCSGCIHAVALRDDEEKCPFCRAPSPTDEEMVADYKKRVDLDDAQAIYSLGCVYNRGRYGFPQRPDKALKLWHRAGKFGHAGAYFNIGYGYYIGNGVERDSNKAKHFWEVAAILGHVGARHNLGSSEIDAGNTERGIRHYIISAGLGCSDSLKAIKQMFMNGYATKDDYGTALRALQSYLDEVRSNQRDEAAAYSDDCKYF